MGWLSRRGDFEDNKHRVRIDTYCRFIQWSNMCFWKAKAGRKWFIIFLIHVFLFQVQWWMTCICTQNIHVHCMLWYGDKLFIGYLIFVTEGEFLKLFHHFKGLGIKANATTYALLIDAHLIARDQKSALFVVHDMVIFFSSWKIWWLINHLVTWFT